MIPIGFAPMDLHARMAIGMKMIITVRFIIIWVSRNGTIKKINPIIYGLLIFIATDARTPPTTSPAPV